MKLLVEITSDIQVLRLKHFSYNKIEFYFVSFGMASFISCSQQEMVLLTFSQTSSCPLGKISIFPQNYIFISFGKVGQHYRRLDTEHNNALPF